MSFGFVNLNLYLILLSDVSGHIIPPIPKKEKKLHEKMMYFMLKCLRCLNTSGSMFKTVT